MSAAVVALVLVAAFLHAGWTTLLRGGADRLWSTSTSMPFVCSASMNAVATSA